MTTELAVAPRTASPTVPQREWALMQQQADMLARSDIIPRAYQRKPANVVVAAMTGRAHGWDALTAMRNGHVIEGTWGLKPEAMLGLVRRAGHSVSAEMSTEGATVTGKRGDTGDTMTVSFTLQDAQRAGLANKGTWKQYPQMMCYWRAVGLLCRALFSDVTLGLYSVEELGADIDADGEVIDAGEVTVEPAEPAEPMPLSEDALARFREACEAHGLDPHSVIMRAWPDRDPAEALTDEHLPRMRAAFKAMVEERSEIDEPAGDDEIVEAEVVEDEPAADPVPADPPPDARPATKAQVGKVKAEYHRVGINGRDEQLSATADIVGRAIETHNHLTRDEASAVIDYLAGMADAPTEPEQPELGR